MSQTAQVLQYLKKHRRGMTQIDAIEKFKCYRLSARIAELREKGFDIRTDMEDNTENTGKHARYFLLEEV
jgi:hypothetical protein